MANYPKTRPQSSNNFTRGGSKMKGAVHVASLKSKFKNLSSGKIMGTKHVKLGTTKGQHHVAHAVKSNPNAHKMR